MASGHDESKSQKFCPQSNGHYENGTTTTPTQGASKFNFTLTNPNEQLLHAKQDSQMRAPFSSREENALFVIRYVYLCTFILVP